MKSGGAFLISGIIILAIGLAWLILGWPPADTEHGGPSPGSILSDISGMTGISPAGPNGSAGPTPAGPATMTVSPTATAAATATPKPSADEIRMHLMDLAFGAGNSVLERWSPTENSGRIVVSLTAARDADIQQMAEAIRAFNSVSQTNQVSTQIKEGSTGDITVKFVPESGMSAIALNASAGLTLRDFIVDDIPAAKVSKGVIYMNADLKGDVRNHTLVRTFFYQLGCVGDTDTYPDSVFSSGENTNTNLSYIDLKAIEILYGRALTPGMTIAEVKNVIYVR